MSVFDFPRINVKGMIQINVGTANNDDYSIFPGPNQGTYNGYTTPVSPPNPTQLGQTLRLANSATVQPYSFNKPGTSVAMNDSEMVTWMQNPQQFATWQNSAASTLTNMIPGEWNLFGNMGMNMVNTTVVGVTVPSATSNTGTQVYESNDPLGLIGGSLSFNNSVNRSTAMLIDVNPEAPPASQVFTDNLSLVNSAGTSLFNGKPSKASTRWINFQRNTYLNGPNGAAGTFQCFLPASAIAPAFLAQLKPYLDKTRTFTGLVFRYTMYRSLQPINYFNHYTASNPGPWNTPTKPDWNNAMKTFYASNSAVTPALNPSYVQISGTIAPAYAGELQSMMSGSFMAPSANNYFYSPGGNNGGAATFSLAPAMVNRQNSNIVSIDLNASLPDSYNDPSGAYNPLVTTTNTKYNGLGQLQFGSVDGNGNFTAIGPINYIGNAEALGDAAGWIFDFKKSSPLTNGNYYALYASNPTALSGSNTAAGVLLQEERSFFVSDQPAVFAEQGYVPSNANWKQNMPALPLSTTRVSSQGYQDTTVSFNKYTFGNPDKTGTYDIWMFNMTYVMPPTPLPLPKKIMANYTPGTPITIPTDTAGVFIITITPPGFTPQNVPNPGNNMMTAPMINCRILPNNPANNPGNADYSQYYTFDSKGNPVATAALNWNALYQQVFRNYYLLYPGMSNIVPMNDPNQWIGPNLFGLLDRVSTANWSTMTNMPRTRDLSATRRWLIMAYCNKFANQSPPANQK